MNLMKWGIFLTIMIGLQVGVSSGSFINEPINSQKPSPSFYGLFGGYDYEPIELGSGWINSEYVPFNLSDWLYPQPLPEISDDSPPPGELFPIVIPEPLPISKEELFGSLATVSEAKKTTVSSLKSNIYFG